MEQRRQQGHCEVVIMANVAFTRDEVILALDTLFFSGEKHLNADSEAIKDLSIL